MRRVVVFALLLQVLGEAGRAQEWQFIDDLDPGGAFQVVADPGHGRLLLGTYLGYRIYHPANATWIDRHSANHLLVYSFLPSAEDSLSLLTGRSDGWMYGYIMDNQGLTPWGPIVMNGQDYPGGAVGAVMAMGRLPGTPVALFACTAYGAGTGYILRSLDDGKTWPIVLTLDPSAFDLAVTPEGAVLIAYGNWSGVQSGILLSADGGETWEEISGDMPHVTAIGAIAVDPLDSQHLYARQGGWGATEDPALGIYESLDGGLHWEQILQGNYEDMSMHPFDADILVAVKEQAIMLTTDGGDTWQDITDDYPLTEYNEQCVICPTDERIYVGEMGPGLWARDIFPTAVEAAPLAALHLSAYPNPFNPSTRLAFGLPAAGPVSLSILDVQGRVVRHLLQGETRAAGSQTVVWDGRDGLGRSLPSGLYFARLEAGGERAVGKLLLLQ